jgi:putative two-component system response regulator
VTGIASSTVRADASSAASPTVQDLAAAGLPAPWLPAGTDESVLADMRLLIVDDLAFNIALMTGMLREAGFVNLQSTRDPHAVAELCARWQPDLVLLDFHMPGMTALDVLTTIDHLVRGPESLPVLIVTSDPTAERRHESLAAGARDFVTKPIDQIELTLRVRSHLLTHHLQRQTQHRADVLDEAVRERTAELEQARLESLTVLASVTEYHDDATHQHTRRVGITAALLARMLELPDGFVGAIRSAAPLHDLGKVGIAREILLKPGPLTDDERAAMMQHVSIGPKILATACSPVLRLAAEIAATHHERWDGQGYLTGLAGEAIPISGRITAVADVFDALTHARPYKDAWPRERALDEIAAQAGRQFDPQVAQALLALDFDELDSLTS